MKGDEFDGAGSSPIPPHERGWRHPAEVAHESRAAFMRESAPPPLSRRTTAIVAGGSLVASAVLIALTLPRGVDDEPTAAETVATVVKGSRTESHLVRLDGRDFGALPVGDGVFVTSASAVGDGDSAEILSSGTNGSLAATVIGTDERLGIAVLRAEPGDAVTVSTGNILSSLPAAMMPEPGMRVVHPHDGSEVNCHPSIALTATVDDDLAPVTVDIPIKGAAIVTDAWGTPLGIVVDRPGGHQMISGAALEDIVGSASALLGSTES
ncbi:MAG: hypothetical protein ACO3RB_02945 [Ilumatobacteraceae bacterium]